VATSLGKLRHRLVDILHKPRELALRLVFSEAKGAQNVDVDVIEFVFLRRSREYNLDFERAEPGRLAY
ncbi:hypothetical protein ACM7PA_31120, partial [Pseudomonas aeruginosa]